MDYVWEYGSPLGAMTMASDGEALVGLWFDGQKHFASTLATQHERRWLPVFEETCRWLEVYFGDGAPDFTPALHVRATPFCKAVCAALLAIPFGTTVSYGELAAMLARDGEYTHASARAVGGAVGHNPVSIIIPCHRVVGSTGSLTGYAGGIERKSLLLQMEHNRAYHK